MKIVSLFISLFFLSSVGAQTLEAHYKVSFPVNVSPGEAKANIVTLEYDGYLYKSGGKNIYFQKPLYLSKFSKGEVVTQTANGFIVFPLFMDTLQRIRYNNTDSLIYRTRDDMSMGGHNEYYVRSFVLGAHEWILLPETRLINGLQCQRAKQFVPNSTEPIWDLWFCPDIVINFGPAGIRDLPGLVVEATHISSGETFNLQSYSANTQISSSIFWPEEFNHAIFKQLKPLQKSLTKAKTDSQKKLEIINQ